MREKLIGEWYCHIVEFSRSMAEMTYIFRADGTYYYKNHMSGTESNSRYTVIGNQFQRHGSGSTEFKFEGDNKLLLLLGNGDNATWHKFERQGKPWSELVIISSDTGLEELIKCGYKFLQDGNKDSASTYFRRALELDPECAQAYLGLLCEELGFKNANELTNSKTPLDDKQNYKKAVQFADKNHRTLIEGYNSKIKNRIAEVKEETRRREKEQMTALYNEAKSKLQQLDKKSGNTVSELDELVSAYRDIAQKLRTIKGYEDTVQFARQCDAKAEEYKKKHLLLKEKNDRIANDIANAQRAKAAFGNYTSLGFIGIFVFFIFFDPNFRNFLYGYNGILNNDGGWWMSNLIAAAPLGALTLTIGIITMIFRNGTIIQFFSVIIIFIAFTINISWADSSGFLGTIFSSKVFLLIPNAIVTIPGLFWFMVSSAD